MDFYLQELYRRIQNSPSVKTWLPPEIGSGEIVRMGTRNGYQASSWDLTYNRDTDVKGTVCEGFRLLFCTGEGVEWKSDDRNAQLGSDEACFCLDRGAMEMMRYDARCRYSFTSFSVSLQTIERMIKAYAEKPLELIKSLDLLRFPITPEVRRKLKELSDFQKEITTFRMLRMEACIQELLWICMDTASITAPERSRLHQDDVDIVKRVKSGIDAEPGKPAKIEDLAREHGISTAKLSRCFKEMYGMPLHAYVIEERLCEGAQLLAERNMTVGEVAERVGYAKQSQFAAAFKKRFGVLPKEY